MMHNIKIESRAALDKRAKNPVVLSFFIDDKDTVKYSKTLHKNYNVLLNEKTLKAIKANAAPVQFRSADNSLLLFIRKVETGKSFTQDYFRNFLTGFFRQAADLNPGILHIDLPDWKHFEEKFPDKLSWLQSCVEGLWYGNYTFNKYKKETDKPQRLSISLNSPDKKALQQAIDRAAKIMSAVYFTRDLQNEPGNVIYPQTLVDAVKKNVKGNHIHVSVLNEKQLKAKNMGGILAVGAGSAHPPRLITITYSPARAKKHIVLVGKGVTFDAGGISLKPAASMGEMKGDMSGAAVVAGTIKAAAQLKLPVRITGIIPAVENMPSGSSYRPGDIVVTSSGTSIEVDNTDAEGRIILSDALHLASKKKPDAIIDLATLTGACVVALGEFVAGLFTNNDALADSLYTSGMETFERIWRLPIWDDFNELIKSDVADVKNVGGRWGGAITAAKFLEHWVGENIPWAHIDIAGPAIPNRSTSYSGTYMTGFGVRLLIAYLEKIK